MITLEKDSRNNNYVNILKGEEFIKDDIKQDESIFVKDFQLITNFITVEEESEVKKLVERKLKRFWDYEESHLDSVIKYYRECQITDLTQFKPIENILNRVKSFSKPIKHWLPVHVLG